VAYRRSRLFRAFFQASENHLPCGGLVHRCDNNVDALVDQPPRAIVRLRTSLPNAGGTLIRVGENLGVQVLYAEGKAVQVELPASVNLKVVESAQGLRGDTASNVTKPAKLETGKTINVPLFIKEGETIKIDTRTGAYMGRA